MHIYLTKSLDKYFQSDESVKQIILVEKNTVCILADDSRSASIFKVFHQKDENSEFEEVHCTNGVGMIIRIFPHVNGGHILFETSDGMIHDIGNPSSPHLMSGSVMTKFLSRCPWIGFASVDSHVYPSLFALRY
jgi:hypothetical protein